VKDCIQSNSLSVGNLQLIRAMAGHADLKITMKHYAQADKEQRERAAAVMDDLLRETDVRMTY